jgi:hypothetical protein
MCISIQKLARCVPIVHKLASQVQIHTKSCETNTWHATSAENNVGVLANKSLPGSLITSIVGGGSWPVHLFEEGSLAWAVLILQNSPCGLRAAHPGRP